MSGDPSRVNQAGRAASEKDLTSADVFYNDIVMVFIEVPLFLSFGPATARPQPRGQAVRGSGQKPVLGRERSRNVTENKGRRASGVVTMNVWLGRSTSSVHRGPPYVAGNPQEDAWGAAYPSPIFEPASEPQQSHDVSWNQQIRELRSYRHGGRAGIAGQAGGLDVSRCSPGTAGTANPRSVPSADLAY